MAILCRYAERSHGAPYDGINLLDEGKGPRLREILFAAL